MLGSISDAALSFAKSVLEDVVGGFTQQQSLIEDMVAMPIKMMMDEITENVWRGKGSEAFKNDCAQLIAQEVTGIIGGITTKTNNLRTVANTLEQCEDNTARKLRSRVGDRARFY